jgi:predicted RNA-binding protein with RPS1 domain
MVTVLDVDVTRKRIALSMKEGSAAAKREDSRPVNKTAGTANRAKPAANPFQAKLDELRKKFTD